MSNFESSKNAAPRSLAESAAEWCKAAILALPLAGCAAPALTLTDFDRGAVRAEWDRPERERFVPPLGWTLARLEFIEGELRPRFAPLEMSAQSFCPTEIRVLFGLLDKEPRARYSAIRELELDHLERLEPALLHIVLNEPDSLLARRAATILVLRCSTETTAQLCRELPRTANSDLKRCLPILEAQRSDVVAYAMLESVRTSGFGEKEARDEDMVIGKSLAKLSPLGRELVKELLNDPEPGIRMAGAVSLAACGDSAALPTLLEFAASDEPILRNEALLGLPPFAADPRVKAPLENALKDVERCHIALAALREMGGVGLQVLAPYARVEHFLTSGLERTGRNPYLPGLAYGEVVEAICRCEAALPADAAAAAAAASEPILAGGIMKLVEDLEREQLRPGAFEGVLALGSRFHPFIPAIISRGSARQLLLTYPPNVILKECAPFLEKENVCAQTFDACLVLSQTIRLLPFEYLRESALTEVLKAYPDAPWLRGLVGQVWREDCDGQWIRATLEKSEPSTAVCAIYDEINAAQILDIDIPLRWTRENLAEIVRNRRAEAFDGRPIAAIVYAEADYNGAFGEHNTMVEMLIKSGYCVMYFDESTDTGVVNALRAAVSRPRESVINPAALIILGAHSSKSEMVFGRAGDSAARVSLDDLAMIRSQDAAKTLAEGGQIVLIACSAGEGGKDAPNVANMFRAIFPHAKERGIWSTEIPDNLGAISLDPETHALREVHFLRNTVYRP